MLDIFEPYMHTEIEMKFVAAHEESGVDILNSRDSRYYNVARPDCIYVSNRLNVRQLPGTTRLPTNYSPDSGKWAVPATQAIPLLEIIRNSLLENPSTNYLHKPAFERLLKSLLKKGYLTQDQKASYENAIPTVTLIEDIENEACNSSNSALFLELAEYYRQQEKLSPAIKWLQAAITATPENESFQVPGNIQAILSTDEPASVCLDSLFMSKNEHFLLDEIAKCPTITGLTFQSRSIPRAINQKFSQFIAHAKHIKELDFSTSMWEKDRMYAQHIKYLAEGLATNASVEQLNFSDQRIGDEGLIQILNALRANPNNKLKALSVFCCGITNIGAQALLEYIRENNPLNRINITYNSCISKIMSDEIDTAIAEKNSSISLPMEAEPTEPEPAEPILFSVRKRKNQISPAELEKNLVSEGYQAGCYLLRDTPQRKNKRHKP